MFCSRVRFYLAVILPAIAFMALEIVSSRLLAPHFGNSVQVWGSIIGVFLAAMSVGYAWGGRLADRRSTLTDLGLVVLASAGAQLIVLYRGEQITAAIGAWSGGSALGTLVATTVLFAPTTILLAMVSPYAVRLATEDMSMIGATAGRLYALSTAGSLVGTLGATFWLVPSFDLPTILRMLLGLTTLAGVIAVGLKRHALWALVLLAAIAIYPEPPTDETLLERRITAYQTLEVRDTGAVRTMTSDNTIHAAIRTADQLPAMAYARNSPTVLALKPDIQTMLVLGLGGGSAAGYFKRHMPELEIDYVDIDPAVPELAKRYLYFEAPEERIHIDDARRFLAQNPAGRWDYIWADTYIGQSIPFHLTTVEFFTEVKSHLNPGGVLGLNILTTIDQPLVQALVRTLREVFSGVHLFEVAEGGSLLIYATPEGGILDPQLLQERALVIDATTRFRPTLAQLVTHYQPLEIDLSKATLLTDRFAPVNHLLRLDQPVAIEPDS